MSNPFAEIDVKWQKKWTDNKVYETKDNFEKKKFYGLIEFPYPSGNGLHVGHPRSYTAMDVITRKKRAEGYNVMFPMGWDAFGLPTENFAIKTGIHPREVTKTNVDRFREQLQMLGFGFDWDREINTTDEGYVKWTQWIFLELFKKGLAYKDEMPINWCTSCKVGLANEEVVNGACERCDSEVVQKVKSQWMLKITDYAERLIQDIDELDYLPRIKAQQVNWIGKSTGAEINFEVPAYGDHLTVFTTRPDTTFGATYMVIAPEHPLVDKCLDQIKNSKAILEYRKTAAQKSSLERAELNKEKTGVKIEGIHAINPVNNQEIPIFVSDYVLITYGTGAIMAVPAHDTRDYEFAKEFDLPIVEVIEGGDIEKEAFTDTQKGKIVNSDFLNGKEVKEAIHHMISWLKEKEIGQEKIQYKLRDWVFSRQRYWGEPIPLVKCEEHGYVPLDQSKLPLSLPDVETFQPGPNGESPLNAATDWVNTTCPTCGKAAQRETDTMPQWAGSCWYFLRYLDPHNDVEFVSKEKLKYWLPIDWYNGGMEHTTLHLLYSRFWYKFLYDIDAVPTKEPYQKRTSHGMILGQDGTKMSKSRGNVINPDELVQKFGADVFRTYEMEMGAFEESIPWSMDMLNGTSKFIQKVNSYIDKIDNEAPSNKKLETIIHKTIKKVGEDIERLKFNTAMSAIRILSNEISSQKTIAKPDFEIFLKLLAPFAPHICEELWEKLGNKGFIVVEPWPEYEETKTVDDVVKIAVQVNGKVRDVLECPADIDQESAFAQALASEKVQKYANADNLIKKIFIKGKMISLVVKK